MRRHRSFDAWQGTAGSKPNAKREITTAKYRRNGARPNAKRYAAPPGAFGVRRFGIILQNLVF